MIKSYLLIARRSLAKNKVFSAVNIFGLAIGLTCCMLIAAFLTDELSYDTQSQNAGNLYRIGLQITQNGGMADYPDVDVAVGAGIRANFPEVLASTRLSKRGEQFVRYGDKQFKEEHLANCDSNFLNLFSIPLIEGDHDKALAAPNSIVISRAFAKKYFGDEPA